MNGNTLVFEYLLSSLVEWKPKLTNNTVNGVGFNADNVVNIETGALPPANTFDYVYIAPPRISQGGVTTGAQGVQRSTETYVLDIYTKRIGVGNLMKRNTLEAMYENYNFISNMFARQGFMIVLAMTDMDYSGNGTARQVLNITRTFTTK